MRQWQLEHIDAVIRVAGAATASVDGTTDRDTVIQRSWQRCVRQHGLDPTRLQEARILPGSLLREHQDGLTDVLGVARRGLHDLYAQVSDLGYVVMLADREGITVEHLGDSYLDGPLRHAGLYLGAQWHEAVAGTCAVGTALATGEALVVHQDDHFDATHIPLTCTAAPVFNSQGMLEAVLDISALSSPQHKSSQHLTLQLARSAARRIENAMFMQRHRADWILKLSTTPEFLDLDPPYLVAVGMNGHIRGHNRAAQRLLEREVSDHVLDLPLERLFSLPLMRLEGFLSDAPGLTATDRQILLTASNLPLFLSVMVPAASRPVRLPSTVAESSDTRAGLLPPALEELCGNDLAFHRTLARAARLATSDISLFIHGETGSGKEFLARALHRASHRSGGPFIAINCAAIPETLIESELFGHLPGSFSGAGPRAKRGLIQEAHGGTLFLDEIGDMPLALQSRLLRVLAEREVLAIGATRPVAIDVRVISATHQALDALVAEGRFRADLYYRVLGARIELPPLRQRNDLDWLINHLLSTLGPKATLSDAARERLRRHSWPGNLRELRNVLEHACALMSNDRIEADDLPEELLPLLPSPAPTGVFTHPPHATVPPMPVEDDEAGKQLLFQYLRASGWNVSAVARQLGVSRMTLYRRMRRHGITGPGRPADDGRVPLGLPE